MYIEDKLAAVGVVLAAVMVLVSIGIGIGYYSTTGTETCTVEAKDRTSNGTSSDARIYTADCGVLVVADSLFDGQWSSADVYQSIEPGKRYEFHTRGFRLPIFSTFPNIVRVVPA